MESGVASPHCPGHHHQHIDGQDKCGPQEMDGQLEDKWHQLMKMK